MEGYLGKKGKRMGSRVKRFMRLDGILLSNHHDASSPPTWRVNLRDADISANTKRNRIVIELYSNKLELYADSATECKRWCEALRHAKIKALSAASGHEEKENEHGGNMQVGNGNMTSNTEDSMEQESLQSKKSHPFAELGRNFKVVKPAASSQAYSSDSSDEGVVGNQPLVVRGQTYEETPASMIFKQFNYPAK